MGLEEGDELLVEAVWGGTSEIRHKCEGSVPNVISQNQGLAGVPGSGLDLAGMSKAIGPLGGVLVALAEPVITTNTMLRAMVQELHTDNRVILNDLHMVTGKLNKSEALDEAAQLIADQEDNNDSMQRMWDVAEANAGAILAIIPLLLTNKRKKERQEEKEDGVKRDPVELVDELMAEIGALAATSAAAKDRVIERIKQMAGILMASQQAEPDGSTP